MAKTNYFPSCISIRSWKNGQVENSLCQGSATFSEILATFTFYVEREITTCLALLSLWTACYLWNCGFITKLLTVSDMEMGWAPVLIRWSAVGLYWVCWAKKSPKTWSQAGIKCADLSVWCGNGRRKSNLSVDTALTILPIAHNRTHVITCEK